MSWMMRKRLGSSVSTGRTLSATGLYFLPVNMVSGGVTFEKEICEANLALELRLEEVGID
jgi:hypothetical protein